MSSIVVQGEKLIARPIDVVRARFVDMQHHSSTRVHADLEVAEGRARVRSTVNFPLRGLMTLLAPLLRIGLQRDLDKALEEDRYDLEQRGYQAN